MSQQLCNQIIELFMVFWCLCCAWGFMGLLAWSLWNTLQKGAHQLQKLHRVPCDRCLFCTGDYRLKCTVHPMTAFSEEAIDCPDFKSTAQLIDFEMQQIVR
jgi:hypothetical protein